MNGRRDRHLAVFEAGYEILRPFDIALVGRDVWGEAKVLAKLFLDLVGFEIPTRDALEQALIPAERPG